MQLSLRAARVNAGLTQQQVTDKTGIARSTLVRWEHGDTRPSKTNMALLCKLYRVDQAQVALEKV